MKGILAALAGLGIGAAVMYLFDPQGGNRRRARIRDKTVRLNRQTREALAAKAQDISNRTKGVVHELKTAISPERDAETTDPSGVNWSDGPAV